MFSVGAMVFPGMISATLVALLISTLLLAVSAVAGVVAYVVAFSLAALILSGLWFTDQGPQASLLLMLVSLNTMGLWPAAERLGLPNDADVFCNTLIGVMSPSEDGPCHVLEEVAAQGVEGSGRSRLHSGISTEGRGGCGEGGELGGSADDVDENDDDRAGKLEARSVAEVVVSVVQDGSITINGGMANQTLFEPRLARLL
ncbi:hypothetical protein ACHAWF_003883 [Thalassiosira exigua]